MQTHKFTLNAVIVMLALTATGCDKNENSRLAEMAERHSQRQAEQSQQMAEQQKEVAEGSRRLVEADAKAREEMVALNRDVQAERVEIGQQRDALEVDRRQIAAQRHRDPIIAGAITGFGLLLACLMPLVLCWYLLHRRVEPTDDQAVAEVLIEDLVRQEPLLLPRMRSHRALDYRDDDDGETETPVDDSDDTGQPS